MRRRYGRRADKQRIAEWFHTHNTDVFNDEYYEINSTRLAPSYNIAPESIQSVVRLDRDTGERVLALMKWGLVPYWSKVPKANFSSINARSDKLESSGAWREPWRHRRCLIPASFFFEWEPLSKDELKKKLSKPWVVSLADEQQFAFGGIWDRWRGHDGNKNEFIIESFTIITTDPNEVLEPFHNRCPLIIEPKDYERWLEPAESSHLPIDLVRTYPSEGMKAWRVARLQGDGVHLLEPLADSSQSSLRLVEEQ